MGRININRVRYQLLKGLKRMVPYKYRKPVYLLFSILGLITYFETLLWLTNSPILKFVNDMFTNPESFEEVKSLVFLVIGVMLFLKIRSFFDDEDNGSDTNKISKKAGFSSLYYSVNSFITFLYFLITVGAFLPFIISVNK